MCLFVESTIFFFFYIIIEGIFSSSRRLEELGIVQNISVYFLFFKFRKMFFYTACHPEQTFTPWWTLFPSETLWVLSHLRWLVQIFRLFSLIRTKTTGVKPSSGHRPNQTAVFWSDRKRWSRSGSNWTAVWFLSPVFWKVPTSGPVTGSYSRPPRKRETN